MDQPIGQKNCAKILTNILVGQNFDQSIGRKPSRAMAQVLPGNGQNFNQCLVENYLALVETFSILTVNSKCFVENTQELVEISTNAGGKLLGIGQNFDQRLGVNFFQAFYKIVHMPCL